MDEEGKVPGEPLPSPKILAMSTPVRGEHAVGAQPGWHRDPWGFFFGMSASIPEQQQRSGRAVGTLC